MASQFLMDCGCNDVHESSLKGVPWSSSLSNKKKEKRMFIITLHPSASPF